MSENESRHDFQLLGALYGHTRRGMLVRILAHFRIPVRMTETVKVEPPYIETRGTKRVSPGARAEAMSNGKRGRKCGAMNVENGAASVG